MGKKHAPAVPPGRGTPEESLLAMTLDMLVPLAILELERDGGPSRADYAALGPLADELGQHADVLLFGGGKPGQAGNLAGRVARSIAVLAFCPGGVTLFGRHFEAQRPPPGAGQGP